MRRLAATFAIAVLVATPLQLRAHRTDEYLQATQLSIARDRIEVNVTLTPGVAVAPRLLATIDHDRDGRISPQEVESYARGVLRDLALTIDGRQYPLTLVRTESASPDEMQDGAGAIRVEAVASITAMTRGKHSIVYNNAHDPADGAYLVNALMPSDPAITIGAQRRDRLQHGIELDVHARDARDVSDLGKVGAAARGSEATALVVGMLAVLVGVRATNATESATVELTLRR